MATVVDLKRLGLQRVLTYPPGFNQATHGCDGCLGIRGQCTQAVAADVLVFGFRLSDGRSGTVTLPQGSADAAIQAAIATWATNHPIVTDPIVGATIP